MNWVKGSHTIAIGGNWAHTQLNILNNNTSTDTLGFKSFLNFVEGAVRTGSYSAAFSGSASRYYRSETTGLYVNDNYKILSNLTLTMGLRWDFDGPLSEKYGKLTAFDLRPACMPITRARIRSRIQGLRWPVITRYWVMRRTMSTQFCGVKLPSGTFAGHGALRYFRKVTMCADGPHLFYRWNLMKSLG